MNVYYRDWISGLKQLLHIEALLKQLYIKIWPIFFTENSDIDPYTFLSISEREEHTYGSLQPNPEYEVVDDAERETEIN